MIHLEEIETTEQNPLPDAWWWCIEFSSDHKRLARLHWIYSKTLPMSFSEQALIEQFLIPTGTWKVEYGKPRFERTYLL
jgi:hypothetical protein